MKGHGSKFGRKKEEAIIALLAQRGVDEAARAVKVTPRTLYRWLKEPAFAQALREARRATFSQCVARLQQAAPAAVTTLLKTLVDPAAPASVRVRAAECIMSHSTKAIELEDIEGRLADLERAAEETTGKKR
jgi:hypothetical protein